MNRSRRSLRAEVDSSDAGDPRSLTPEECASWMTHALAAAERAGREGEVPVGAALIQGGDVLGVGWNQTLALRDPTAHAEVLALRRAAAFRRNHRIPGAVLVTTLEPCLMCLGALLEARVEAIVCGAPDPDRGALALAESRGFRGTIVRGVEVAACAELLRRTFEGLRER